MEEVSWIDALVRGVLALTGTVAVYVAARYRWRRREEPGARAAARPADLGLD
ncbi:MAG: hypothetical protein M3Q22_15400 [Actinomycetota bacterium]|nr:hypothetical protein [Actinomycetota bacterium]